MKKILLAISLFALLAGCSLTQMHQQVPYHGKRLAQEVYVEHTKMDVYLPLCDRFSRSCDYLVETHPKIHNPAKKDAYGNLVCDFYVNQEIKKTYISPVFSLWSKHSIRFDVARSLTVSVGGRSTLRSRCYFRYMYKKAVSWKL